MERIGKLLLNQVFSKSGLMAAFDVKKK